MGRLHLNQRDDQRRGRLCSGMMVRFESMTAVSNSAVTVADASPILQ
jgi:hypothetical protein